MADGSLIDGHGSTCPEVDVFREAWGCDHDNNSGRYLWLVRCSYCEGDGCFKCDNRGIIGKPRCPLYYLNKAVEERRVFQAYSMLKNFNTWPVDGGLNAQSAWFVAAVAFLTTCLNELESKRIQEARRGGKKSPGPTGT